jgi:hypothetical protein
MKRKMKKVSKLSEVLPHEDINWRTRRDYDTLMEAQDIAGDRGRMRNVKSHANKQRERAARVARLEGKLL